MSNTAKQYLEMALMDQLIMIYQLIKLAQSLLDESRQEPRGAKKRPKGLEAATMHFPASLQL